jgi:hypothetical protein
MTTQSFPHPCSGFDDGQSLCALPSDSSRSTFIR